MPAPAIISVSTGGLPPNTIKITGSGFTGATAVLFGSVAARNFLVDSDLSVLAVSPSPLIAGAIVITVTTPGGSSTAAVLIDNHGAAVTTVSGNSAGYLGPVSSQSAMTALPANIGDFCFRVDLGEVFYLTATPATSAANWSTAGAAFFDNADGTLTVDRANVLEPLSTVTIATTSISPPIGQTTYYNATSGNLTPVLPALSGLRVGARLAVRRDPADISANTVTLACAGSDTFYSSAATSATFPLSGEQREFQVISVSGTKYWVPAGSLNPISALDKRYRHAWPFPMARNTIAAIGDSLTALGDFDTGATNTGPPTAYQPLLNNTYIQQLPVMTHQRIMWGGGQWAVSASYPDAQLSQQLPVVLAMNPLPGACVLACGGASMVGEQTGIAYDFAANQGYVKSMVAALLAAGVVPIMFTIPPLNSNAFPVSAATVNVRLNQWNVWVRRYAAVNGFPLIDTHTALALVDGTHIGGTTDDGDHPNGKGHRLIAQQFLADGGAGWFPPNSLVNTARTTDDLTNLFNDGTLNLGLFTVDTNSDGVADGLTVGAGTGTYSRVAPVTTDLLMGDWQQITVTAGNSAILSAAITSGWSTGDRIAFSCRVQTANMESSGATFVLGTKCTVPGGFTLPDGVSQTVVNQGPYQWSEGDVTDGTVYVEFPIPPGTTALNFQAWITNVPAGSATLRFGEVTVRNLTQGGFLV